MPEPETPRCLRCGSDSIIPDVRPIRDTNDQRQAQAYALARNPKATLFKDEVRVASTAHVCAECGFVEVYVVDPEALWQAHLERIANGWKA